MDKEMWKRASIQQIAEFILHGVEVVEIDKRGCEERMEENSQMFVKSLHEYRKKILENKWDGLTEEECIGLDEDLYAETDSTHLYQNAINVAFEMGLIAGMKISTDACEMFR